MEPFCKEHQLINAPKTVFEDKELSDKAVLAVEKQLHHDVVVEDKQGITEIQQERKELV